VKRSHFAFTATHSRQARSALAALAAAATGFVLAVFVSAPASATGVPGVNSCGQDFGHVTWNSPATNTVVTQLVVRILVGGDDIRSGTAIYGKMILKDNTQLSLQPIRSPFDITLNGHKGYANGSLLNVKVFMPDARERPTLVHVRDIRAFDIYYNGLYGDGYYPTPDNWNMSRIRIIYPKNPSLNPPVTTKIDGRQYDQLLFGSGSPYLHRFKENCQSDGGPDWAVSH
jgi:hypothetical protein